MSEVSSSILSLRSGNPEWGFLLFLLSSSYQMLRITLTIDYNRFLSHPSHFIIQIDLFLGAVELPNEQSKCATRIF
jgi:hypothetical protein